MKTLTKLLALTAATLITVTSFAEGWKFGLSPYLWFAGLEGTLSTIPGSPKVPVDISPSQALEDLDASYMVWLNMRSGRHGIFVDFTYTDVRSDFELIPAIKLEMQTISKSTLGQAAYSFNLYNDATGILDFIVGGRYWDIDTTLNFSGGLGVLAGKSINSTESWVDPMVGIMGRMPIGNSDFYASGLLAAGGFGVGSSIFYDVNLNFGYQWTPMFCTAVGYRYLDVKYDDDGFVYDVAQQGFIVNLTFWF